MTWPSSLQYLQSGKDGALERDGDRDGEEEFALGSMEEKGFVLGAGA